MLDVLRQHGYSWTSSKFTDQMLEPHNRSHLLQNLRPPLGYELDHAIATTFSLNLAALLRAPLAFSSSYWEEDEEPPGVDPLATLEASRRYASRISIFCQTGRISVPKSNQPMFSYLEDSIFQVSPPKKGYAFHPKIWILRFVSKENPTIYRLLSLTRNITFGPRWDTVLALEGKLVDDEGVCAANDPLGRFIAELPRLSLSLVPTRVQQAIDLFQNDLRRTIFELPEGFRDIRFWPLGIEGASQWPFAEEGQRNDRILVMSPFLSDGSLVRLKCQNRHDVLLSRSESLERIKASVRTDFGRVFVINPSAAVLEDPNQQSSLSEDAISHGLHAKLYIAERGETARVWTGSANANNAAYGGNVEFLVELIGNKSQFGIDAFLTGTNGKAGFLRLLQDFHGNQETDEEQERLDLIIEDGRQSLSDHCFVAQVLPDSEEQTYQLTLKLEHGVIKMPEGVVLKCRPITLPDSAYCSITTLAGPIAEFGRLSADVITAFFAFELSLTEKQRQVKERFVINARLEGAPSDRGEKILLSLISEGGKKVHLL